MAERRHARIGDIFIIEKGITGLAKANPGPYPLVTTGAERKTSLDYQFNAKAVCIPLVSSTGHGKKTLNYVHYQEGNFALGSILAALLPKDENIISARYLHVYLQKNKDRLLVPLMRGAANVSLSIKDIANLEIPIPPLKEQETIIKKIDGLAENHRRLLNEIAVQLNLLEKLRQQVLQEAIEGKLTTKWRKEHLELISGNNHASRLLENIKAEKEQSMREGKIKKEKPLPPITDEEKPFDLPEGWAWCRLGEITNVVRGGSPRPAGDKRFYEGNIPFLKVSDLTSDNQIYLKSSSYSIKEAGLIKTRHVEANTLMLTNSGATLGIPKICTFPTTFNDGIAAFLGIHNHLNKVFLYYFLKAKSKWFLMEAARGQGQPNLNTDIIGLTTLALPPTAEQQAIVERVENLLNIVDELEIQVSERKDLSEKLMQAVLREAFTEGD